MNLWLLNNNSSSVRHQQGHEREMTHRHTHIQKKLKKGKKISVGSQPQFIHCEAISLQAGFSSGLVFVASQCGKNAWDALLMPCSCLLTPSSPKVV